MIGGLRNSASLVRAIHIVAAILSAVCASSGEARGNQIICTFPTVTIGDDFEQNDVLAFCRLVARSPDAAVTGDCTFEEYECLKGAELLAAGRGGWRPYRIKMIYFGDKPLGTEFYCCGLLDKPEEKDPTQRLSWGAPTLVDRREQDYVRRVPTLPTARAERLPKLYEYLEDPSPLLAFDVQEEIDRATYAELCATRAAMPKAKLLGWIADPKVSVSRRRQYLRMLGICGTRADLPFVQSMIARTDRETRRSLDAQIECFLALAGEAGLPLIEDAFLKDQAAEYQDAYSALMALRFSVEPAQVVSKSRAIGAFRLLLDWPKQADLVIPDLARAKDWDSAPRIMQLCRDSVKDKENKYVLVPAVNFFRECPTPAAKAYLVELAVLDPEAVRRSIATWPNIDSAAPCRSALGRPAQGCYARACRHRPACGLVSRIASSWRCRVGRPAFCRR